MATNERDWGLCVLLLGENGDALYAVNRMPLLLPQPRINASGLLSPTLLCRPSVTFLNDVLHAVATVGADVSIGVDVPFGWPVHHANFLSQYSAETGVDWTSDELPPSKEFALRYCDRRLQQKYRAINPLAVGADRIASAAYRWADVRLGLPDFDIKVDFGLTPTQSGIYLFETYPAAFVHLNAGEFGGYKSSPDVRRQLLDYLLDHYEITLSDQDRESLEWACEQQGSPDAFDSFICALTAWDHLRYRHGVGNIQLTTPEQVVGQMPDAAHQEQIRKEGWILIRGG